MSVRPYYVMFTRDGGRFWSTKKISAHSPAEAFRKATSGIKSSVKGSVWKVKHGIRFSVGTYRRGSRK